MVFPYELFYNTINLIIKRFKCHISPQLSSTSEHYLRVIQKVKSIFAACYRYWRRKPTRKYSATREKSNWFVNNNMRSQCSKLISRGCDDSVQWWQPWRNNIRIDKSSALTRASKTALLDGVIKNLFADHSEMKVVRISICNLFGVK